MFEGVIFDLDGTLLDSLEDIASAANEVLKERGFAPIAIDNYRTLVGDGVAILMARIIPACASDTDLRAACIHSFERHYDLCWNKRSKPYEGIVEMLNSLVQANVSISVLSNKPDPFTKQCIAHYFPDVPFSIVLGHSERFPCKPDPASARWIGEHLGIAINRIAYVGDTNTDMKTAVSAGIFAMGVSWGFRTRHELVQSGARVVYDHPAELLAGLIGR